MTKQRKNQKKNVPQSGCSITGNENVKTHDTTVQDEVSVYDVIALIRHYYLNYIRIIREWIFF